MYDGTLSAALAVLVMAPTAVAILAAVLWRREPAFLGRLGALTAGAGAAAVLALLLRAGVDDTIVSVGSGVFALAADRLATAVLLLIFGVSTLAQAFAVRYLAGDRRAGWFTAGAGLLTAASALMVTATTVVGIALGWSAAGIALCMLLATYWELPTARDGVRRTALAFLVGDAALWVAVMLITVRWDVVALDDLRGRQIDGPLAAVIAVLVVTAALSRSAQIPFHRWLPATLAAPTPVSALLHAGVVNAGAVLLIKMSPLTTAAPAAALTVAAGAATMAYGAVVMLVKPDVKGALAHSTMAQMGFMIFTCGLGLWAAAVIHLFAHGFYKATLFLSSGSAIANGRRQRALPPAPPLTGRRRLAGLVTAVALPLIALTVAVAVVPLTSTDHAAERALLVFAWVSAAAATWGWLRRRPDVAGAGAAAAFLLPAALAYVAVITAATRFLAPALPPATASEQTVWVTAALALALLGGLALLRSTPLAAPVQRFVYTHALGAGHLSPPMTGARS